MASDVYEFTNLTTIFRVAILKFQHIEADTE